MKTSGFFPYRVTWTVSIIVLTFSLILVIRWIITGADNSTNDQVQGIVGIIGTTGTATLFFNFLINKEVEKGIKERKKSGEKEVNREESEFASSPQFITGAIPLLDNCIELLKNYTSNPSVAQVKDQLQNLKIALEDSERSLEERRRFAQEAQQWLDDEKFRINLAIEAVTAALKKCPLKNYGVSDTSQQEAKESMYQTIFDYLDWIMFSLEGLKAMPLDILRKKSRYLPVTEPYLVALKFIEAKSQEQLSSQAVGELKLYLNILRTEVP